MTLGPPDKQWLLVTKKASEDSTFYTNVASTYIWVTEERLRMCLNDRLEIMEQRRAWLVPLGFAVTFWLTILTTEPRSFLWLTPDAWQAFFFFCAVMSTALTAWLLLKRRKAPTVDDIVAEIRGGAKQP